jgi:hypothetical protein
MTPNHEQYWRRKAEQEAKYKSKFLENWFGWWRNPPDRFAFLIALFTAGLFAATAGLWVATRDLVDDARASGRAWIVPHILHLEAPLKAGETAKLLLYFGNSGREPAINVGQHHESASLPVEVIIGPDEDGSGRLRDAIQKMDLPDSCELASKNRLLGVVYPGAIDGNTNSINIDRKWITDKVATGFGFVVIKGCIIYETIRETHKSRYCFFYAGQIAALRPPEHQSWLQSCPSEVDNQAD